MNDLYSIIQFCPRALRSEGVNVKLSPEWVCILMGFPAGWLDDVAAPPKRSTRTAGPPGVAKRSTKASRHGP